MALRANRLSHTTPDWVQPGAEYFITVCAEQRKKNHFCHPELGAEILDFVRLYNERGRWFCELAVLMPDHVHLIVCFPPEAVLSRVVGLWKRNLARNHGISWQRNFFEHRLRDEKSLNEKAEYILQNPVRAGLMVNARDWPYIWMPSERPTAAGTAAATLKALYDHCGTSGD